MTLVLEVDTASTGTELALMLVNAYTEATLV